MVGIFLSFCLWPTDAFPERMTRGDLLLYERRYEEAIAFWREALERSPEDVELLLRLGVALSLKGDYVEAERTFKRALQIKPEDPKLTYNLGLMYIRWGKDEEALRYLKRTLKLVDWYPEANYHIGLLYEKKGLEDEALKFYVREVNKNPACAGAWRRIFALRDRRRDVPTWAVVLVLGAAGLTLYWLAMRRGTI